MLCAGRYGERSPFVASYEPVRLLLADADTEAPQRVRLQLELPTGTILKRTPATHVLDLVLRMQIVGRAVE